MSEIKDKLQDIELSICHMINFMLPKSKNRIFFYSMPDFSDNSRAIFEEMQRQGLLKKYKVVWSLRNPEAYSGILHDCVIVRHRSLRSLWHFSRSRYLVRTHSLWGNKYINNRQVMFIAWHGMPLKNLLKGNPVPVKSDFLNVTSDFFADHMYKAIGEPKHSEMILGMARNDLLFMESDVLRSLGLSGFNRIYLWMPTFRQASSTDYRDGIESELGIPVLNFDSLTQLNRILKQKNELLILKLHPWSAKQLDQLNFSNILNLKDSDISYPYSLYNVLASVDVLITDYSSVYIDFLLTDKPIVFIYDDIDEYRSSRGFAFEPAEQYMPGVHLHTTEDVLNYFQTASDDDPYLEERIRVKKLFHKYCDGNSAKRALDAMGVN